MRFLRIVLTDRGDHAEVKATWPAREKPAKRPALQKAVAAELRRWAGLLERGKWESGGSAAGPETETRVLLHELLEAKGGRSN